ncbi:MAG: hypothetical protein IJT41_04610 [Clostridia bacterium]|nr:hypothetical protein [Clostridia bacterium]
MKRTLCILLSLVLTVTGLIGLGVPASAVNVGDIILFGNYPQTKVSETTALKNAANAATWNSYGYYIGNGSYDGKMAASDFMKYADFFSSGVKYRAVKFTKYRPYATRNTSGADNSYQDENGYSPNTTYYFKFEPLEWRVLDPSAGLVLCETIIDAQAYQNFIFKRIDLYVIEDGSTYANNYAKSSIRSWLNNDFYYTAFNSTQRNKIKSTTVSNDRISYNDYHYNEASTTDPIFMLSYDEAQNSSYGLTNNDARKTKGTDYAKCQGLNVDNSDFSRWWLRSGGSSTLYSCSVIYNGSVIYYTNAADYAYIGIRPACILTNLASDVSQTNIYTVTATANPTSGGTVSGNGAFSEGQPATVNATPKYGWHFTGWFKGSALISSDANYTFPITENVTLTAQFSPTSYTVTTTADPTEGGTVTGGGTYAEGQTVTLNATPNSGWFFQGWYSNYDEYRVSSSANYSFPATKDVTMTAKFRKYKHTVTVTAEPAEGGMVTGGGTYETGAYATLTATPNSGWHFIGWYLDGALSSTQQSFFRPVVSNLAYVAKFEKDAPVNPTQNAKLNVPQSTEVGYKSTVTVTVTAEDVPEGYFVALYEGDTQLAKGDNKTVSYTMTKMKASKTLTAKIIDSNGNVQSTADGKLEKEIKITVKTGFFDKVKAFFLGLFGLLPKVELKP